MSRQTLNLTMKLESDAIFGSGYSIPGAEDMDVCRDREGYPYLKGSSLKGLLKESVENWLSWTGGQAETLRAMFGTEGWEGTEGERRIRITALTLDDRPVQVSDCYSNHTFTMLENGVVKAGTLREAVSICRGLSFKGQLSCAEEDLPLVQQALACIKWAGTMRNRGFGKVKFETSPAERTAYCRTLQPTHCIRYRIRTVLPVLVTDLSHSYGYSYETMGLIPGTAIRGAVIGRLVADCPEWFQQHRDQLLSTVRFLDVIPCREGLVGLPTIKGFYEKKDETGFVNVVLQEDLPADVKRAKLGAFCAIEDQTLRFWGAKTGGVTRIRRDVVGSQPVDEHGVQETEKKMFQTRYLEAGQELEGYILLDDPSMAEKLANALGDTIWLGADRYEGFGQCAVEAVEGTDKPSWQTAYGYTAGDRLDRTLYLLACGPLCMLDQWGEPVGLDERELACQLGIDHVNVDVCSTSMSEYGNYNRAWRCREPGLRMYDRGSIFKLTCSAVPELDRVLEIQRKGLGVRICEGCGQVLFLRGDMFESIEKKAPFQDSDVQTRSKAAELRRARLRWQMSKLDEVRRLKLSPSQLGQIQTFCQKAISMGGDTHEMRGFLSHSMTDRGPSMKYKYEGIGKLISGTLTAELSRLLGVECEDSKTEKLRLLVELFDHSRKEGSTK